MSHIDDQIALTRERLHALQAKAKKLDRRDETRRKILYGAAVLALALELDEENRKKLFARLHSHIQRDRDRAFLNLAQEEEVEKPTA